MSSNLIWPLFWLIIIFYFKNEIKAVFTSLINIGNRSKKISYMGINIDLGTNPDLPIGSQQQFEAKQQNLMKAYQTSIVTNEENTIRSQLVDAGFTVEKSVDVLIYHLANTNLLIKFLFIDKLIFQEQIKLLSYLNSQAKFSTESDLMKFYNEWKEKVGDSDYTYEQFLSFLLHQRLISQQINGYSISPLGKEYLSFLIKLGRTVA